MTLRTYGHQELHALLLARCLSPDYRAIHRQPDGFVESQALHCPYYVPLEGTLGADWGVIVNPQSHRFGRLTFEHDGCGCWSGHADDPPTKRREPWLTRTKKGGKP